MTIELLKTAKVYMFQKDQIAPFNKNTRSMLPNPLSKRHATRPDLKKVGPPFANFVYAHAFLRQNLIKVYPSKCNKLYQ